MLDWKNNIFTYVMLRSIIYVEEVKQMPMTPREIIRLLEKNGFVHVKSNAGSHQKYYNSKTNITVAIPVHAKELKKGLENAILKQAGLKK